MATETFNMRTQILANAKFMLKTSPTPATATTAGSTIDTSRTIDLPALSSEITLIPPTRPHRSDEINELEIVIFGATPSFTAAVMVGLIPAIEGDRAQTPEHALRKLLYATCELLNVYIPKVGTHQRNIHGGGVFDEDMISTRFTEGVMGKKEP